MEKITFELTIVLSFVSFADLGQGHQWLNRTCSMTM
jgi:hypothetical protein